MKALGKKGTKSHLEGHQDCSTCHPRTKAGRAFERKRAEKHEQSANQTDKWESRLNDPTTQVYQTSLGQAVVMRNSDTEWYVSVGYVAPTEEAAKDLAETLLAILPKKPK